MKFTAPPIESVAALREAIVNDPTTAGEMAAHPDPMPPRMGESDDESPSARTVSRNGADDFAAMPASGSEREDIWSRVIAILKTRLPALAANLEQSLLREVSDDALTIEIRGNAFTINRVKRQDSIEAIQQAVKDIIGRSPTILVQGKPADPSVNHKKKSLEKELEQRALSHPLVSEAVELFKGKVVEVRILAGSNETGEPSNSEEISQ